MMPSAEIVAHSLPYIVGPMAQLCFSFVTLSTLSFSCNSTLYHLVISSEKRLANPKNFLCFPRINTRSELKAKLSLEFLAGFINDCPVPISLVCLFRRKDFFV